MPDVGIFRLPATLCQHDLDGSRIFQHRNADKWRYEGDNARITGFWFEDLAFEFLADLRSLWSGRPFWTATDQTHDPSAFQRLANRRFVYRRTKHEDRVLFLRPDGSIRGGNGIEERFWSLNLLGGATMLSILGEHRATCHLQPDGNGWRGRACRDKNKLIMLTPIDHGARSFRRFHSEHPIRKTRGDSGVRPTAGQCGPDAVAPARMR